MGHVSSHTCSMRGPIQIFFIHLPDVDLASRSGFVFLGELTKIPGFFSYATFFRLNVSQKPLHVQNAQTPETISIPLGTIKLQNTEDLETPG